MVGKKSWFVVIAGHVLERYEVTLYGFFASILAPIFFPNQNPGLAILLSMSTVAAGYIMRPLGGLIFGHIGDKMGRKKALLASMLFVTIPTLIIGSLPTYQQIGLLAPIALVCSRLLQGLCVGGEYSGATIFFFEHVQPMRQGIAGSIMSATAFLGAVLGTVVGTLTTFLFSSDWGWRIPFLLGAVLNTVLYFMRRNLLETPLFEQLHKQAGTVKYPLADIFKYQKLNILGTFFIGSQGHIILYVVTIYMNTVLTKTLNLLQFQVMMLNTCILMFWCIFILFFGYLADKVNKSKLLLFISLAIGFSSYPLFLLLNKDFNLLELVLVELIMSFLGSGLFAISASFLPSLFQTKSRYTGLALGLTLGQALLGGTSPLIATYIAENIGSINAILTLLVFDSLIGLIGILLVSKSLKTGAPLPVTHIYAT
jgi:MHS family proline/betaine transporter-like MFS transporter